MKHWHVNELSKLTNVSVRTLHHYDQISLLKPGLRLANGYRLYSEPDLLKLQQIIALKFLGFKLSQIKVLVEAEVNVGEHFSMQARFLQEKAETLLEASTILTRITSDCSLNESIPWETIIQLIEVFRMTQQLEHSWVKNILNQDEIKQLAVFEQKLKTHDPDNSKAKFEHDWAILLAEIEHNIKLDPASKTGIEFGERCMRMVDGFYGRANVNLRTKIWDEGYMKNQSPKENAPSPATIAWLGAALDAYWRHRIYSVLAQVESSPHADVLMRWNQVLEDMYGDSDEHKNAVFDAGMTDEKVSPAAKKWLKDTFKR